MKKNESLGSLLEKIRLDYPKIFELAETTDEAVKQICQMWFEEQKFAKVRAEIATTIGEESSIKGNYILQIKNHQVASCGTPPYFDDPENTYLSYFENEFGEQNIYLYHYPTQQGYVYVADAGWEHPRRATEKGLIPMGMAMGEEETLWLRACWLATGNKKQKKL